MSMEFKTAKRRAEVVEFTIDGGDTYHFTPPKKAGMILPALHADDADSASFEAMRGSFDWLSDGLAEGESEKLEAKLRDPKDDFDFDNLQEIIKWLTTRVSGRPTS